MTVECSSYFNFEILAQGNYELISCQWFRTKSVLRNNSIDALAFYKTLLGILVESWGIEHRPARYDFGLRYLKRDLPQAKYQLLEKLLFVSNLNQISENLIYVAQLYKESLSRVKAL